MIFCFFGIDSRSHGLHGDDLIVVRRSHGAHDKEGRAALGMSSVLHFLIAGHFKHMIDHCRQIVHANFMPTEVPELGGIRIECGVVSRVAIATCIAQPNVIVVVGQQVAWSEELVITWSSLINHIGDTHPDSRWGP